MPPDSTFEYDVAFSFHAKDEAPATQLNDLLQDRFSTFLYSERQKELAGTDGEKTFNEVFGIKARFVVVFYRSDWGQTPFTRIEETAIRNRAFDEGFDFTLFIPTESPANAPKWLPKPRLYYGAGRFGLMGAAAVVEARIQELGGEPRIESTADRAVRYKRAQDLRAAKAAFHDSEKGVLQATEAFDNLWLSIENHTEEMATKLGLPIKTAAKNQYKLVYGIGVTMLIYWENYYSNTLNNSSLTVEFLSSVPRLFNWTNEEPQKFQVLKYDFGLLAPERFGYVNRGTKEEFSAESLAEHVLKFLLDEAEKHKREH